MTTGYAGGHDLGKMSEFITIPESPAKDDTGLKMQIIYADVK